MIRRESCWRTIIGDNDARKKGQAVLGNRRGPGAGYIFAARPITRR